MIRVTHGPDRIAAARPLPAVIWNRIATKVKLEYVPPTQEGPKNYQVDRHCVPAVYLKRLLPRQLM